MLCEVCESSGTGDDGGDPTELIDTDEAPGYEGIVVTECPVCRSVYRTETGELLEEGLR